MDHFDFQFNNHNSFDFGVTITDKVNSVIEDYVDHFESARLPSLYLDWDFDSTDWDVNSTSNVEVNTSSTSSSTYINRNSVNQQSKTNIDISGADWNFSISSDGNSVNIEHHNLEEHEVQNIIKHIDSNGNGIIDHSDLNDFSLNDFKFPM